MEKQFGFDLQLEKAKEAVIEASQVYQTTLDELEIDTNYGDYIGYYETESRVRYYSVSNDGRVTSDNKHTYGGYKPYYRSITASPVSENEFRGL